jgi:hypothetical protein
MMENGDVYHNGVSGTRESRVAVNGVTETPVWYTSPLSRPPFQPSGIIG